MGIFSKIKTFATNVKLKSETWHFKVLNDSDYEAKLKYSITEDGFRTLLHLIMDEKNKKVRPKDYMPLIQDNLQICRNDGYEEIFNILDKGYMNISGINRDFKLNVENNIKKDGYKIINSMAYMIDFRRGKTDNDLNYVTIILRGMYVKV
jgi:hypothetical protein